MTRSELCARVAARSSLSKAEAAAALGALTSIIADALAEGETVTVAEFGKFEARSRAVCQGRNPRTGEPVAVPAARLPTFKAAKPFATLSTCSEPSPVDSDPVIVAAGPARHGSAFATAPRRHAIAGTRTSSMDSSNSHHQTVPSFPTDRPSKPNCEGRRREWQGLSRSSLHTISLGHTPPRRLCTLETQPE